MKGREVGRDRRENKIGRIPRHKKTGRSRCENNGADNIPTTRCARTFLPLPPPFLLPGCTVSSPSSSLSRPFTSAESSRKHRAMSRVSARYLAVVILPSIRRVDSKSNSKLSCHIHLLYILTFGGEAK